MTDSNAEETVHEEVKCFRAAFKLNADAFAFRKFDEVKIPRDQSMLSDSVLRHCRIIDLCRKKGSYERFHPDFVQSYYIDMHPDSISPCGVFIFIEQLQIVNGSFTSTPRELNVINENKTKGHGSDYEILYTESRDTSLDGNNHNRNFCTAACRFLKGGAMLPQDLKLKDAGFLLAADQGGMLFIKNRSFQGFVPSLKPADTLLPLVVLTGITLAHQYSLRQLGRRLSAVLDCNLKRTFALNWRSGKYAAFFTDQYRKSACFLGDSVLSDTAGVHSRYCKLMQTHLERLMHVREDYDKIREKLRILSETIRQLETKNLLRSQSHIRWSVFLMGLSIVICAVAVSVILGAEPLIRLLINIGLLPQGFLNVTV